MHEERFKRRIEGQLKVKIMKSEYKNKNEDEDIIVNRNIKVKLYKLVINKCEGAHMDWFLFWNQFEKKLIRSRQML